MSLMTDLKERLRALFGHRHVERELDEEMRFHLEREIAQRVAGGADPDDASRAARIALGGLEQVKEQVRDARGVRAFEDVTADVRQALRGLRANAGFALTVLAVLGIALGAATTIFAVVDAVLLSDARHGVSDRLVRIYETNSPTNRWALSSVDALALVEQQKVFDAFGLARLANVALSGAADPEHAIAGSGTAGFFAAAGARAAEGRLIAATDELESSPWVAVVSHGFATERFPGRSAIGQPIVVDGVQHAIVGVLPQGMNELAGMRSRIWLPLRIRTPARRGPFWMRGIGRLGPGVSIETAERDMAAISARIFPIWASSFRDQSAVMKPFLLRDSILGDAPRRISLFAGAVGLVWLIALANVATLMLVRASSREQELAVRMALGASRFRIVRLLVTDSLVLTIAAGIAGLAVAGSGIELARAVAPDLPRIADAVLTARVAVFAIVAAIVSGVLVCVPALIASLSRRQSSMRLDTRRTGRDRRTSRVRSGLVALEFALALPLLASACWFVASLWRLQGIDQGFEVAGAVTLRVQVAGPRYADGNARAAFWQRLEGRARTTPGVRAAGLASDIPPDEPDDVNNFDLIDRPARGGAEPTSPWNGIRPGYFEALGIPILQGRDFNPAEYASGTPAVLVSASWAQRYFPGESALGRKMVSGGCTTCPLTEVIGVVGDVKYQGFDGSADAVYQPSNPANASSFYLVARTQPSDEDLMLRQLTQAVHGLDPDAVVDASTMSREIGEALDDPRHWTALVSSFAAAAGTLAAIGLFGLMSYVVRQQRREIGVRMALGATPGAVTRMVVTRGVRLAAAGVTIGAVLAWFAGEWLLSSSFGIKDASHWTIAGIMMALAGVAALSSWWPGHQAARVRALEAMSGD